eukprot:5082384-Pyramimonas_sp.AAC.1
MWFRAYTLSGCKETIGRLSQPMSLKAGKRLPLWTLGWGQQDLWRDAKRGSPLSRGLPGSPSHTGVDLRGGAAGPLVMQSDEARCPGGCRGPPAT